MMSLSEYIEAHRGWSLKTFGPPKDTDTVKLCAHIAKEISEVLANPKDPMEWVDIMILAIDGAIRNGYSPDYIAQCLIAKQLVNESRAWNIPSDPTQPNEHVR